MFYLLLAYYVVVLTPKAFGLAAHAASSILS